MRRIRIAAATVMVAAGLIGAVAAPASAEAPRWIFEGSCDAPGGPEEFFINATQRVERFPESRSAYRARRTSP